MDDNDRKPWPKESLEEVFKPIIPVAIRSFHWSMLRSHIGAHSDGHNKRSHRSILQTKMRPIHHRRWTTNDDQTRNSARPRPKRYARSRFTASKPAEPSACIHTTCTQSNIPMGNKILPFYSELRLPGYVLDEFHQDVVAHFGHPSATV